VNKYSRLFLSAVVLLSAPAYAQNSARFSDVQPTMHDRALECDAIVWANRRANSLMCREVYKRAVIVSNDWELCTDKTHYVTGRRIHMVLYGETYDGRCGLAHFVFTQKHEGRGYFSRKLKGEQTGNFYAVACE
jgi:hypothetical protein